MTRGTAGSRWVSCLCHVAGELWPEGRQRRGGHGLDDDAGNFKSRCAETFQSHSCLGLFQSDLHPVTTRPVAVIRKRGRSRCGRQRAPAGFSGRQDGGWVLGAVAADPPEAVGVHDACTAVRLPWGSQGL